MCTATCGRHLSTRGSGPPFHRRRHRRRGVGCRSAAVQGSVGHEAATVSSYQLLQLPWSRAFLRLQQQGSAASPTVLFHHPAFAAAHTLSHLGIRATKHLMSARWVWVGMAADIARWCHDCQHCQRAKVTKQPRAAIQHIPIPTRRFSHVHINLVGPLPRSPDEFNHISPWWTIHPGGWRLSQYQAPTLRP